ncbi:MAG: MT-A70 family methyltransferase [Nitrosopumilus sp.]|nr:MT-A70 family methyltransferase [Nitrosopumilus sp.]
MVSTRARGTRTNIVDDIMIPFPGKKYKIIYADPPWFYSRNDGRSCPYPMLGTQNIIDLPVKEITDKDCILFMWATFPRIQEGLDVIKGWGFEYKTIGFNWVKRNKNGGWFWGMGNWTRSNSEVCLIGTKGTPKRLRADVHQVIDTPFTEHSRKPDSTRQRILELCGDLPRIELFARTKIHGWDTWGNDEKLQLQPLESFYE